MKKPKYLVMMYVTGDAGADWLIAYSGGNRADADRIQAREARRGRETVLMIAERTGRPS